MSERTMYIYGIFTLLGILLFIWAYTIIGSGSSEEEKSSEEPKEENKDKA